MPEILIITDNKGKLFNKYIGSASEHKRSGVDVKLIIKTFEQWGYCVIVKRISDVDFSLNYKGVYVLYTSSEARGGIYKEYIENVLLYMKKDGAHLIPSIYFFRAHHNKSFQEMMRKRFSNEVLRYPNSIVIDEYDSIYSYIKAVKYPVILKMSRGSGSEGVVKVDDEKQLLAYAQKMMKAHYRDYHDPRRFQASNIKVVWRLKEGLKRIFGLPATSLQRDTVFCNTLIIQEFIENLSGDYKILFFGNHYYALYRENRKNDFRASGSGRFVFPTAVEEIADILDFAEKVALEIGMPCISMDIARSNNGCVLIEYQCVYFGNYTMQYSEWYYMRDKDEWKQCKAVYGLEEEYCRAIHQYIENGDAVYRNV